jgi:hypothetical protein
MDIEVSNFCTTSFILKDQDSVEYIEKLCRLFEDESNLVSGFLQTDACCKLYPYGKEEYSFILKANGFIDSGPEIRSSVLFHKEDAEEQDEKSINLFDQIQKHLKNDTWFFVDECSYGNSYIATSVSFYHQNEKVQHISNYEIKKEILKKMGI